MNDLELYGTRFTVDGERVHPSRVRIEMRKPFQIPNLDRMSRRDIENEIGITEIKLSTVPLIDTDGGYEIPSDIVDSLRRWLDAEIIKSTYGEPKPSVPVPDFSVSSLLTRNMT